MKLVSKKSNPYIFVKNQPYPYSFLTIVIIISIDWSNDQKISEYYSILARSNAIHLVDVITGGTSNNWGASVNVVSKNYLDFSFVIWGCYYSTVRFLCSYIGK